MKRNSVKLEVLVFFKEKFRLFYYVINKERVQKTHRKEKENFNSGTMSTLYIHFFFFPISNDYTIQMCRIT